MFHVEHGVGEMKLDAETKFKIKVTAFESMRGLPAPVNAAEDKSTNSLEWWEWNDKYSTVFDHFINALETIGTKECSTDVYFLQMMIDQIRLENLGQQDTIDSLDEQLSSLKEKV